MKKNPNLPDHGQRREGKNITWRIALAELQSLFYSPIAWITLIVLTIQLALGFANKLDEVLKWKENTNGALQPDLTSRVLSDGIFGLTGIDSGILNNIYLFIPLITMGLMSREFQSGSIKLLYSSPVKNHKIIFGKYLSVMIYALSILFIVLIPVIWSGLVVQDFGWQHAFTAMLGAFLLICTYAAIGLFMSSLTSYQVVAAISTLAVLSFFGMIGNIGQGIDHLREITYWLSMSGRAESFIDGLISTEDVLYFIIVSLLFLFLSIIRLNAVRQQQGWKSAIWKYFGVVAIAVGLGYISSRPSMKFFHDATYTKKNTLTKESQQIVQSMKGGLTITTFVNILDDVSSSYGMPQSRKYDMSNFNQFIRFKPEIDMKYVYYYADTKSERLHARYPGLDARQILEKICIVQEMDPNDFPSAEEIEAEYKVDLKSEDYRMVRLLKRESGEETFLRMFDDAMPQPKEEEIAAALKRIQTQLPVVGFLQGHGERSFERQGDRSYRRISTDKLYRNSLINNGFDFRLVHTDKPIAPEVDLLVIAEVRDSLSAQERSYINEFIARGGNLFVLGDIRRQAVMNPIIEPLGVQFMPGQLVRIADDGFLPDFLISRASDKAVQQSFKYDPYGFRSGVSMPGCLGLQYTEDKGFSATPFFRTQLNGVWNEMQSTEFVDKIPVPDTTAGEKEGSYITALALTRELNGKEQRILITGDADCIGNGEISIFRSGVPINNSDLAQGSFYWLSGNRVPIDTRRPKFTDNTVNMKPSGLAIGKIAFVWIFPALMLAACLMIWFRRRGR